MGHIGKTHNPLTTMATYLLSVALVILSVSTGSAKSLKWDPSVVV